MKKILIIILIFLFSASPAFAMKQVLITGSGDGSFVTSRFIPVTGNTSGVDSTEVDTQGVMPVAGTFSDMYVTFSGAPQNGDGSQTFVLTLRVNGSNTTLT